MKAKISEIFQSIQGEGIFCGVRQLFIRFYGCNLSCYYCDTEYNEDCVNYVTNEIKRNPVDVSYVQRVIDDAENIHSVSFTGGEPLLYADFIAEIKKTKRFYLETNMTIPEKAKKLKFFDIVAGDLKIREVISNFDEIYDRIVRCFKVLRDTKRRITFCKIVLPPKFDLNAVLSSAEDIKDYVRCFVLQPVFGSFSDSILELQKEILKFSDARVIPQIHKYLGVK